MCFDSSDLKTSRLARYLGDLIIFLSSSQSPQTHNRVVHIELVHLVTIFKLFCNLEDDISRRLFAVARRHLPSGFSSSWSYRLLWYHLKSNPGVCSWVAGSLSRFDGHFNLYDTRSHNYKRFSTVLKHFGVIYHSQFRAGLYIKQWIVPGSTSPLVQTSYKLTPTTTTKYWPCRIPTIKVDDLTPVSTLSLEMVEMFLVFQYQTW